MNSPAFPARPKVLKSRSGSSLPGVGGWVGGFLCQDRTAAVTPAGLVVQGPGVQLQAQAGVLRPLLEGGRTGGQLQGLQPALGPQRQWKRGRPGMAAAETHCPR